MATPPSGERPSPARAGAGAALDSLIGKVIAGRYRVVSALGRGGTGAAYRALHVQLDRPVALRVLGPGHGDDSFQRRFLHQASVTARLAHPNTLQLLDFGRTEDGGFYLTTELLGGRTLVRALREEGAFAAPRVVHIAQQICRSLGEAHGLGVHHRDLKPANVFLLRQHDDHDFVKVLSYGLVPAREGSGAGLDNSSFFTGTAHYLAPEQARRDAPDHRADIYSLGALLFHMLAGRVPFDGQSSIDVIARHLAEPPPPLGPAVDPRLEQVVLRCLVKDPAERFQSMEQVLAALQDVRKGMRRRPPLRRALPRASLALPVELDAPLRPPASRPRVTFALPDGPPARPQAALLFGATPAEVTPIALQPLASHARAPALPVETATEAASKHARRMRESFGFEAPPQVPVPASIERARKLSREAYALPLPSGAPPEETAVATPAPPPDFPPTTAPAGSGAHAIAVAPPTPAPPTLPPAQQERAPKLRLIARARAVLSRLGRRD